MVSEAGLLLLPNTAATARGAVVYITYAWVGQLQQVVARVRLRRVFCRRQWVSCVHTDTAVSQPACVPGARAGGCAFMCVYL